MFLRVSTIALLFSAVTALPRASATPPSAMPSASPKERGEPGGKWHAPVQLSWREAFDAYSYEVQLNSDSTFEKEPDRYMIIQGNKLTTQMPIGIYYMRVRHKKDDGAFSIWSTPQRIEVRAPGPDPVTPDSLTMIRPDNSIPFQLQWKPIAGCDSYLLRVFHDEREVIRSVVKNNIASINKLGSGDYSWNVACAVKMKGRFPASEETLYEGNRSQTREFRLSLEREEPLTGPRLLWPKGFLAFHPEPVIFRWEPMHGNRWRHRYSVHLYKEGELKEGQVIALNRSEQEEEPETPTIENEWTHLSSRTAKQDGVAPHRYLASKLPPGNYKWEVEVRDSKTNKLIGRTEEKFQIRKVGEYRAREAYVGVGAGASTLGYSTTFGARTVSFDGNISSFRVAGEYWFLKWLGIDGGYQYGFGSYKDERYSLGSLQASMRARSKIGGDSSRWGFNFRAGLSIDSLPEIVENGPLSLKRGSITRTSLLAGGGLNYGVTEKLQAGVFFDWLQSFRLSGGVSDSQNITGNAVTSYRTGVGARGFWFWPVVVDVDVGRRVDGFNYNAGLAEVSATLSQWELRALILYGF